MRTKTQKQATNIHQLSGGSTADSTHAFFSYSVPCRVGRATSHDAGLVRSFDPHFLLTCCFVPSAPGSKLLPQPLFPSIVLGRALLCGPALRSERSAVRRFKQLRNLRRKVGRRRRVPISVENQRPDPHGYPPAFGVGGGGLREAIGSKGLEMYASNAICCFPKHCFSFDRIQ